VLRRPADPSAVPDPAARGCCVSYLARGNSVVRVKAEVGVTCSRELRPRGGLEPSLLMGSVDIHRSHAGSARPRATYRGLTDFQRPDMAGPCDLTRQMMVTSESTQGGLAAPCGGLVFTEIPPPWPGGVSPHPQVLRIANRVSRRGAGVRIGKHGTRMASTTPYHTPSAPETGVRKPISYHRKSRAPIGYGFPEALWWTWDVRARGSHPTACYPCAGDGSELSPTAASRR
jgi:hypothetical protein